jgi:arylsulfatase A-like enzyme
MTGFHTGHSRVRGNIEPQIPLREADVTVAELLKRAGYHTGMFGKWGLGEPYSTGIPSKKGFDEFFGYLDQTHAHNYWTDTLWDNEKQVWLSGNFGGENKQYSHDVIAKKALEFLEKQGTELGIEASRRSTDVRAWTDLAHVLVNVKEFIYVP